MSVAALSMLEPASDSLRVGSFIIQKDRSWNMIQLPVCDLLVLMTMEIRKYRTFEDSEAHDCFRLCAGH